MKKLSLAARMSLLFTAAVLAVLAVTAILVHQFTKYHFRTMDHHVLEEKLEATGQILQQLELLMAEPHDLLA